MMVEKDSSGSSAPLLELVDVEKVYRGARRPVKRWRDANTASGFGHASRTGHSKPGRL